jgi:hypothetical protein
MTRKFSLQKLPNVVSKNAEFYADSRFFDKGKNVSSLKQKTLTKNAKSGKTQNLLSFCLLEQYSNFGAYLSRTCVFFI